MSAHEHWMRMALEEAALAAREGETPVGAVLIRENALLSRAHNRREQTQDPTAHAEMLALREGAQLLERRRLNDCTLYVTLEPCPMCAGAMVMANLGECLYGAADPRQGCYGSVYAIPADPAFTWHVRFAGGLLAAESQTLLTDFFKARRSNPSPHPSVQENQP